MVEILLILLGAAGLLGLMLMWARAREAVEWNDGTCTECRGSPMVQFDTDSHGGRGYRCNKCHRRIWISYGVDL